MQSIALLRHLIDFGGGLEAVKLEGYEMYDSGDPLSWLKSQIDHAIRREDIGEDISIWLRTRIGKERNSPE
jgi:UTP-glucose-1-phosphate uridylyltransferase